MTQIAAHEDIDIDKAFDVLVSNPEAEDDQLSVLLEQAGYDRVHVNLIMILVPSAFAHHILADLGIEIDPDALLPWRSGKTTSVMLSDLPIYCRASAIARKLGEDRSLNASTLFAIGSRSAELNAVQQAVDAGEDIRGGKIKTSFVTYAEDLGFPRLSLLARCRDFFSVSD